MHGKLVEFVVIVFPILGFQLSLLQHCCYVNNLITFGTQRVFVQWGLYTPCRWTIVVDPVVYCSAAEAMIPFIWTSFVKAPILVIHGLCNCACTYFTGLHTISVCMLKNWDTRSLECSNRDPDVLNS